MRSPLGALTLTGLIAFAASALTSLLPFAAGAQPPTVHLEAATAKPFLKPFPFKAVRVLDNQAGSIMNSPPAILLDRAVTEAIQGYIDTVTRLSPKGDKNLLLNIREMLFAKFPAGSFLLLEADVYYSTGKDIYHPFLNINLQEARWKSTPKNNYGFLLDQLIAILSEIPDPSTPPTPLPGRIKRMVKNDRLHLLDPTPSLTLEQIDIPARTRWFRQYPALQSLGAQNGVYWNFQAFRDGELQHDMIDLQFDTKDSTYHVPDQRRKQTLPYVIARDGELFKLLPNNCYVRLSHDSAVFQFYIPHSLPDMESLSRVRSLQTATNPSGSDPDHPLAGAAMDLTYAAVAGSIRAGEIKRTQKTGLNTDEYRNCMINMDNGNIMYK
ncbi:MAG TPA: hypothetical protein VL727_06005 [Puia sp.]|jgi:hypothetical protein|nr:hypothetical protein [Puia sp.]